jgi:hypothetical protein
MAAGYDNAGPIHAYMAVYLQAGGLLPAWEFQETVYLRNSSLQTRPHQCSQLQSMANGHAGGPLVSG